MDERVHAVEGRERQLFAEAEPNMLHPCDSRRPAGETANLPAIPHELRGKPAAEIAASAGYRDSWLV